MVHVLMLCGYTAYQAQCIAPLVWMFIVGGAVCEFIR